MAIKPQILTELKHGKFICRAVYPTFVATWNWLVRFSSTMKGDFDVNPKAGLITVDRTDPDHPVIRFRQDRLPASKVYTGPFNPVSNDDGIVTGFEYCYFQVGGLTFHIADVDFSGADCIVALKIPVTTDTSPSEAEVVSFAGLEDGEAYNALIAAQTQVGYEYVPLFILDDNRRVKVDFRAIPTFQNEEMI